MLTLLRRRSWDGKSIEMMSFTFKRGVLDDDCGTEKKEMANVTFNAENINTDFLMYYIRCTSPLQARQI